MTWDDAAKVLGVVGGIAGPAGFVLSVMNYRRDAARVRVQLQRGRRLHNLNGGDDMVRAALADYRRRNMPPPMSLFTRDPDKTWGNIEVSNYGRRAIEISAVGWVATDGKSALPGGYVGDPNFLPTTLDEAQSRDFPIEDSRFDEIGVLAVFARDSLSRFYYGSFSNTWLGFKLRLKILFKRKHI